MADGLAGEGHWLQERYQGFKSFEVVQKMRLALGLRSQVEEEVAVLQKADSCREIPEASERGRLH
jgi:hypothetical protein